MNRFAEGQKAAMVEEALAAQRSGEMSMVRGFRTAKGMDAKAEALGVKADQLIGQAILAGGQGVLLALRTFSPGLADQIEEQLMENPEGAMQLWELIQSRPAFQKHIAPRLKALLAGQEQPTGPVTLSDEHYGRVTR